MYSIVINTKQIILKTNDNSGLFAFRLPEKECQLFHCHFGGKKNQSEMKNQIKWDVGEKFECIAVVTRQTEDIQGVA